MILTIAVLAALPISGCSRSMQSALALTGATVIDVRTGSRIADAVVVIESDRIISTGRVDDIPIPAAARVIDACGKYVIRGHGHAGQTRSVLILDADPTQNIANTRRISAVVLGGRLVDRNELNRMLDGSRRWAAEVSRR